MWENIIFSGWQPELSYFDNVSIDQQRFVVRKFWKENIKENNYMLLHIGINSNVIASDQDK